MKKNLTIVFSLLFLLIVTTSMQHDKKDELIIRYEQFGKELFHIKKATYNFYEVEKNRWEFVIYIETDYAIKRSKELEVLVQAEPTIEVTAILNKSQTKLAEAMVITQKSGYDYSRDEYLSNIYYFTYETVEDFQFKILKLNQTSLTATMHGNCVINGSNGLKPDAQLLITTQFKRDKTLKRTVK